MQHSRTKVTERQPTSSTPKRGAHSQTQGRPEQHGIFGVSRGPRAPKTHAGRREKKTPQTQTITNAHPKHLHARVVPHLGPETPQLLHEPPRGPLHRPVKRSALAGRRTRKVPLQRNLAGEVLGGVCAVGNRAAMLKGASRAGPLDARLRPS